MRKLAHQLGVEPSRIDFLETVAAEDLRTLRRQIGDYLFEADKHHFGKVAMVSAWYRRAIAAKVTEFALPPLIAARTAELMDPHRAAEWSAGSPTATSPTSARRWTRRGHRTDRGIPPEHVSTVGASSPGGASGWSWAASSRWCPGRRWRRRSPI